MVDFLGVAGSESVSLVKHQEGQGGAQMITNKG